MNCLKQKNVIYENNTKYNQTLSICLYQPIRLPCFPGLTISDNLLIKSG